MNKNSLSGFVTNYSVNAFDRVDGTTRIMGSFLMLSKDDVEQEIQSIIEDLTKKGWKVDRSDFRVSRTSIVDKIITESIHETHPEYFI